MDAKTVFLIALGLAAALPYVTVALLKGGGRIGLLAVTGIFVAAIALVVLSDRGDGDRTQPDDA